MQPDTEVRNRSFEPFYRIRFSHRSWWPAESEAHRSWSMRRLCSCSATFCINVCMLRYLQGPDPQPAEPARQDAQSGLAEHKIASCRKKGSLVGKGRSVRSNLSSITAPTEPWQFSFSQSSTLSLIMLSCYHCIQYDSFIQLQTLKTDLLAAAKTAFIN